MNNMDFTTKDVPMTVVKLNADGKTYTSYHAKVSLKWTAMIEVEARSWGIKNIQTTVVVPDQTVEVEFEYDNEEGETVTLSSTVEVKDAEIAEKGSEIIYPVEIEQGSDGKWRVEFSV